MVWWVYAGLGSLALLFGAKQARASTAPKSATLFYTQTPAKPPLSSTASSTTQSTAPPSFEIALAKLTSKGASQSPTQTSGIPANVRPLLDLIGRAEAGGSYDAFFNGSPIRPPKPVSTMTISELQAFQNAAIARGSRSSAAGKYQIIKRTLATLPASGQERFSPAKQDALAIELLRRRGLDAYRAGRMTEDAFMRALSQEWASLPKDDSGRSYYHGDAAGNRALVSPAALRQAIRAAR